MTGWHAHGLGQCYGASGRGKPVWTDLSSQSDLLLYQAVIHNVDVSDVVIGIATCFQIGSVVNLLELTLDLPAPCIAATRNARTSWSNACLFKIRVRDVPLRMTLSMHGLHM